MASFGTRKRVLGGDTIDLGSVTLLAGRKSDRNDFSVALCPFSLLAPFMPVVSLALPVSWLYESRRLSSRRRPRPPSQGEMSRSSGLLEGNDSVRQDTDGRS